MNPLALLPILKAWWKAGVGLILGFILCWPVASCSGRHQQAQIDRAALDRANVQALQIKAQADAVAAERRLTDTIAVSNQERAMIDAVRQGPDSAPDSASLRLGCQRLRAANPTAPPVPACAGLDR